MAAAPRRRAEGQTLSSISCRTPLPALSPPAPSLPRSLTRLVPYGVSYPGTLKGIQVSYSASRTVMKPVKRSRCIEWSKWSNARSSHECLRRSEVPLWSSRDFHKKWISMCCSRCSHKAWISMCCSRGSHEM